MRPKKLTVLAALVGALVVPVALPAPAMASVTGSVAFHCTAKLPAWPGTNSGVCESDSTPAVGYVSVTGTDSTGQPYIVKGNGSFRAAFHYSSSCAQGGTSVLGTAQGEATVEGVRAFHLGQLTTADVHAGFRWARIGGDAVITIDQWWIDFANGGWAQGSIGHGDASFVPIISAANTCLSGGPMKALVQGDVDAVT
jgi:hypothetical protein